MGVAGLGAAEAVGVGLSGVVLAGFALWVLLVYASEPGASGPFALSVQPLSRHGFTVVGVTALVAAMDLVPEAALWGTIAAVLGGTAALLVTRALRRTGRARPKVIVVGDAPAVEQLLARWAYRHEIDVVAACVPEDCSVKRQAVETLFEVPVLGSIDAVAAAAQRLGAEVVAVAPGGSVPPQRVQRLGWVLEDLPVRLAVIGLPETWAPHRLRPTQLGRLPLVEVRPSRRSWFLRVVKDALDRLGAAVLLVLSLPVLAVAAIAVRLDGEGPAFFRQRRVGVAGREFTMYKLRTMYRDAEQLRITLQQAACPDKMLFKLANDPRITRVGRVLRRLSIDELPQLLNVVRGDMSLIGPRPALPEEVARYDEDARRRLVVKPGLTGLWQVSGRSNLSWEESLALDLHYVDNWRLSDDAVIAARTFRAVLSSRGAY